MAGILPSASYVRSSSKLRDPAKEQAVLASLSREASLQDDATQLWELLKTPQTVDSLRRSLGSDSDEEIRSALSTLFDQDLIEVSPDS